MSNVLSGFMICMPFCLQRVDDVRYVKAMFPYHSPTPDTDELEFDKGDIFSVSNELADGWLWAVNQRTGQSGTIYSDLFIDLHVSNDLHIAIHFFSMSICQKKFNC